jgi:hypothetical protein
MLKPLKTVNYSEQAKTVGRRDTNILGEYGICILGVPSIYLELFQGVIAICGSLLKLSIQVCRKGLEAPLGNNDIFSRSSLSLLTRSVTA